MKNETLQTIAQVAVNNKKANKTVCFEAIKKLAATIDANDNDQLLALANLYSYFLPSAPKKPKTAEQWVSLAMGKKDLRVYLNYTWQQENGDLVATDGHRMHLLSGNTFSETTAIDNAGVKVSDVGRFPNYERIKPNLNDAIVSTTLESLQTSPNVTVSTEKLPRIDLNVGDHNVIVDANYWNDAISMLKSDSEVYLFIDRVVLVDDNKYAIIMGVRG